jgi:serine/threonine protein kinase
VAEVDTEAAAANQAELRGVLPACTRLRSYELVSVLGQGAFGITYRARDTTLSRDVAIKE